MVIPIFECPKIVTPHAGVWIEIPSIKPPVSAHSVTPHAGVWIEIRTAIKPIVTGMSLPMRECGLK